MITIEKAITVLEGEIQGKWTLDPRITIDAHKLGIAALKRLQLYRNNLPVLSISLLPGETKE